jgi:3-oxoacyl-[acyl-carrier protein] reductase
MVDRAALVTGSSRGIGAATAERLAEDGFDVVVHYHEAEQRARRTVGTVREAGVEAVVLQADLADPDEARRLAEASVEHFEHLDTLVNNAGMYPRATIDEVEPEDFERVTKVNAQGAFNVTKPLVPHLEELGGGRIVNLSSILGVRGSRHGTHYSSSKAAVLGFTKSLARELAEDGILVNAICPGAIETDMIASDTEDERQRRRETIPMGRVGQPEEVAGVVRFLVGEDASYVTGETFHVNGGLHMP